MDGETKMVREKPKVIRLREEDNVAVALESLSPRTPIDILNVTCREPIPKAHKVSIRPIRPGDPIVKYNQVIGFASRRIEAGEHVHLHNLEMGEVGKPCELGRGMPEEFNVKPASFQGIVREDGRVGTRNYVAVLATVSCASSAARFIADAFRGSAMKDYPNVDGVLCFGHGRGCSTIPGGEGLVLLQRVLAGYAAHPNLAGVLILGLGCEVNELGCLSAATGLQEDVSTKFLNIQEAGGTGASIERGIGIVRGLLRQADRARRSPVPLNRLVAGLECGGSDAFSGISANPALGVAVDLLIEHGATAILSETPEIYGAEHLLTSRAASPDIAKKLLHRIRWWEDYTRGMGGDINNNPTPGNKAGGLTTILEKSLGAVAKSGTSTLVDVYEYAEPVVAKGLVFMDTPGNDPVSVTGMIAGGANLLCFTTGRGSVCGFTPVPTLKLASNTEMYGRMEGDMDVNCGVIVDGQASVREAGERIFRLIVDTASGKRTKSEGYGTWEGDFVPWEIGPVL